MNANGRIASALLMFWTGSCLADTTMVFENSGPGSQGEARIEIADGHLRTTNASGKEGYMLFDASQMSFIMVNPKEKSYIIFDNQTVQQIANAQRQAMKQMEDSLAKVPAAQREQMRGMMKKMMGGAMPGEPPQPRRYERGGNEQVAGHDCEILKIYVGDRLAAEQCVADPDDLDIDDSDFATIRAMQQFVVDLTSQFSFMSNQVLEYGEPGHDEMPIRYVLFMPMVGESTGRLKLIESDDIDPSRFEIPAGFKEQEMPAIGG
jgi:hypothetical protein